jgi:hypothetical protein
MTFFNFRSNVHCSPHGFQIISIYYVPPISEISNPKVQWLATFLTFQISLFFSVFGSDVNIAFINSLRVVILDSKLWIKEQIQGNHHNNPTLKGKINWSLRSEEMRMLLLLTFVGTKVWDFNTVGNSNLCDVTCSPGV